MWLGQPTVFSMSMKCFVWFESHNHPYVNHKHTTGLVSVLQFVVHELLVNTCPAAIACCFTYPSYHLIFFFALQRREKWARGSRPEKAGRVHVSKPQSVRHSASPSGCQLVTTATVIISSNLRTPPHALSASPTSSAAMCQRKTFALQFATGDFSNDTGYMLWRWLGASEFQLPVWDCWLARRSHFSICVFVGCWSHYNSYLMSTTYKAFGSPPSSSPKGLLSNGTSMPTMEVGFLCLSRHCTSL